MSVFLCQSALSRAAPRMVSHGHCRGYDERDGGPWRAPLGLRRSGAGAPEPAGRLACVGWPGMTVTDHTHAKIGENRKFRRVVSPYS